MSRIVQIAVDEQFSSSMRRLNEELARRGEEIVSTEKVTRPDGVEMLMVSVNQVRKQESKRSGNNLLLDSAPSLNNKRVLLD